MYEKILSSLNTHNFEFIFSYIFREFSMFNWPHVQDTEALRLRISKDYESFGKELNLRPVFLFIGPFSPPFPYNHLYLSSRHLCTASQLRRS